MTYVSPREVNSPKDRLSSVHVISEGSQDEWALAEVLWDAECDGNPQNRLAIRWNGGPSRPKGNPVSSSYPVWFILPEELAEAARAAATLRDSKISP